MKKLLIILLLFFFVGCDTKKKNIINISCKLDGVTEEVAYYIDTKKRTVNSEKPLEYGYLEVKDFTIYWRDIYQRDSNVWYRRYYELKRNDGILTIAASIGYSNF